MTNKRLFRFSILILAAALFAVALTGCRLPASEGPLGAATEEFPLPAETEQNMGQVDTNAFATQTAQAQIPPQPAANTPVPAVTDTAPAAQPPAVPPAAQPTTAPAAPVTYVQATAGGPPASYTLQAGEFPFCIARRFNVNQSELLSLNGLGLNSVVQPGTTLRLPQTGNHFQGDRALRSHPTNYTVAAGDTIFRVACKFGDVSPDMIILQNNLSSPYTLTSGTTLVIP